jgi:hypothetical protein
VQIPAAQKEVKGQARRAETIYSLLAIKEGLTLCRSVEPRYGLYSVVFLLALIGCGFELKMDNLRPQKAASP